MPRWNEICAAAFVCMVVAVGHPLVARAEFEELLAKLPASPNVLVMLDAEQIFASDVATKEGWKQRYESTYADAPLLLPPSAKQFVLAADVDLTRLDPRWQVAVMRLSSDPSLGLIAKSIRGTQDRLAGMDVVSTPRGAIIVQFAPHIFGLRQPGDRQATGRWLQATATRSVPELSAYLKTAADVPDRVGTEIIMAIDLADVLSPDRVREAMAKSKVLSEASVDRNEVASVIAGIRGMTLGARVIQRVHGELRVDFEGDAKVLADIAKPLLLEALGEAGASIDEFADWEVTVDERRVRLDGELTRDGLRRLFSFLEIDATVVDGDDRKPADATEPSVDAYTSQKYFQSVVGHLNDLKRERGASSYYTIAVWFDKYARRIDRLPILHVDKELVDYGQRTVSRLRDCVAAIRGAGIRSGTRSAQVASGDAGYGYGDGYTLFSSSANYAAAEVGAVEQERRAIRAQEQGQSSTDVRSIIRQIEEDTSNIRRKMTERYDMEFDPIPRRTSAK